MAFCHLENAELEPTFQKYKGPVVLRGDLVKDDFGAMQCSLRKAHLRPKWLPQKLMDVIARLPDCDGRAADAVSALHSGKIGRCSKIIENSQRQKSPDIWIRLPRPKWPKSWNTIEHRVVPLEGNLYGHPVAGTLVEEAVWRSFTRTWMGKGPELGMSICSQKTTIFSYRYTRMTSTWL